MISSKELRKLRSKCIQPSLTLSTLSYIVVRYIFVLPGCVYFLHEPVYRIHKDGID